MKLLTPTLLMVLLLIGCASTGTPNGAPSVGSRASGATKAQVCRSGDVSVTGPSQCLKDDAACYQISDGSWCTGQRGNTCPAGSVAVPAGTACPAGARCFDYNRSLTCAISTG